MLVRSFNPSFLLAVLVSGSLVFFFTYTYGSTGASQLVAHLPLHDQLKAIGEDSAPHQTSDPSPKELLSVHKALFDWKLRVENFPLSNGSLISMPHGKSVPIPTIQYQFENSTDEGYHIRMRDQRDKIRDAMRRCWRGYKSFAWLKDELAPKSAQGRDLFGGWAATLVDSLDTLWIMDMIPEFEEAVEALKEVDFTFTGEIEINTFETTIRYLGGLLATHDLTEGKYPIVLDKAIELATVLYAAFDTPNRMPITRWNWKDARDGKKQEAASRALLAEVGSLSLEFTRLTQITKDPRYFDAIQRISDEFEKQQNTSKLPGMWPVVVNPKNLDFSGGSYGYTLSAMADSTYEYLPKQYLLLGGQSEQPRKMYEYAIETAKSKIFFRPMTKNKNDILISGAVEVGSSQKIILNPEGQHLSCYLGGVVGIGSKIFSRGDDLSVARKLLDGCLWAYDSSPAGIMPEIFHTVPCEKDKECDWNEDLWLEAVLKRHEKDGTMNKDNIHWKILQHRLNPGFADIPDRRYILRPEAIESLFILYRITGDEALRDRAWQMFELIEKTTKTRFGNAAVNDVTTNPPEHADSMESFWTAETLKYFYLTFCEQTVISLDEWVFNTEAHPFRRPKSEIPGPNARGL